MSSLAALLQRSYQGCVAASLFAEFPLSVTAFGQVAVRAATETARVTKYAQNDIVPVKSKLRFDRGQEFISEF